MTDLTSRIGRLPNFFPSMWEICFFLFFVFFFFYKLNIARRVVAVIDESWFENCATLLTRPLFTIFSISYSLKFRWHNQRKSSISWGCWLSQQLSIIFCYPTGEVTFSLDLSPLLLLWCLTCLSAVSHCPVCGANQRESWRLVIIKTRLNNNQKN